MNPADLEMAFGQVLNLDLQQIFLSLLLSLILGLIVAVVYRFSVAERVLSRTMQYSLVLLCVIGTMVMLVIGNNVARAFSLVGALAIIRFRTRLRSPWDITFVFFSLAAGIACGVMAYRVAVMGTLVVSLAVFALHVLPLGGPRGTVRMLRCDLAAYQGTEGAIGAILDRHVRQRWLVEARSLRFGETLSYRYRVVVEDDRHIETLLRELSDVEGIERVVLDNEDDEADQDE